MHFFIRLILLQLLITTTCSAQAKFKTNGKILAKVVRVIDGDTFDVVAKDSIFRIRLLGIDAPEAGQEFYKESKKMLSSLALDKDIWVEDKGQDVFHRMIAITYRKSDTLDVNREMVRTGLAWHFTRYSSDEELARLEKTARQKQLGIWSIYHYLEPWEFRKH